MATSTAAEDVHAELRAPGLFDWELRLDVPDRKGRRQTLASLVGHLSVAMPGPVLSQAAAATEGFTAAGLRQLLEGARLAAATRRLLHEPAGDDDGAASTADATLTLCASDVEEALRHGAAGAPTHSQATTAAVSWSDVGGLEPLKRVLFESVILPRERPELFAAAPLRLTSGALLYGHTGCGKTFLARALAAEARLPFLTVKGPELLNKYIGASEAAVRDLFARAASCQPCIIFFDEFEAIAPRRGQDSTGVTDRVVNQLLCELDGIESLRSVFVLAASNRPELIDPALLRPGRLDRKLHCPLPDLDGRAAILNGLLSKACCEASLSTVDMARSLARRCDGYSGADLQALLTSAQLAAVHEAVDQPSSVEAAADVLPSSCALSDAQARRVRAAIDPSLPWIHALDREWWRQLESVAAEGAPASGVCIGQRHLETALQNTRRSISAASRRERDAVFLAFASGEPASQSAASRVVHA